MVNVIKRVFTAHLPSLNGTKLGMHGGGGVGDVGGSDSWLGHDD